MKSNLFYIVVTPFFPTPEAYYGGYIFDQVEALIKCGKNVMVFRPTSIKKGVSDYTYNGITVYQFPTFNLPSYILNGITDGINRFLFEKFLSKILTKEIEVEAIHCHTTTCALYGNILKEHYPEAKAIIQYHDLDPYTILNGKFANNKINLNYKIRKVVPKIEKYDINVSVSDRVQENLLGFPQLPPNEHYQPYLDRISKISKRVKKPKINTPVVLINGINPNIFYPNKHAHDGFVIGCIGNFIGLKNHITLIDSVKLLVEQGHTNIKLKLVGNNPYKGYIRLKEYVCSCGMEKFVEFVPPMNHENLNEFYNSIDLFVLPSEFEGFGCVFTEAAACNVPFMSVRHQGIDSMIPDSDKDLWLIENPREVNALASKILRYMNNRETQQLTQPFDINILIKDFLSKINQ